MRQRNIVIGAVGIAILLVAGVWFFFIRSDAPPPASLDDAVAAVTGETTLPGNEGEAATGGDSTDTTAPTAPLENLDGTWVADQSLSFAGYRIGEELANIGTVTAVGRTSDVEANLTFAGTVISDVTVTVDMTTLQSDRSQRDNALRTRGLETADFPTATFALTEPIDLGTVPTEGESISVSATGDLTLHGVTNSVVLELEGVLVDGTMIVVGSTEVTLTDYDIEAPTGFSVLTIEEVGTLEVQLAFVPS
jgi:polyisoprenoid-binding protein YceI